MQEKLVITGMGAVTPIGIGVDTYWNNLVDGKCGIDHITRFDASELPVQIAAQVKDFNPDDFMTKKQSREMDLFMQYGYAAATEALAEPESKKTPSQATAWALSLVPRCPVYRSLRRHRMG